MYNYKNPFAEFNTNTMTSEQVSELYAEPFDMLDIKETDIVTKKTAIIFVGGRGTGKTMLLRQFSYNVQKIKKSMATFSEKIKNVGYFGVYFRIDNPLLKSLDSFVIKNNLSNSAETIFTHYFELSVFKEYLEIIKIMSNEQQINTSDRKKINTTLFRLLPIMDEKLVFEDIDALLDFVISEINYIQYYQSRKAVDVTDEVVFEPKCGLVIQGQLTNGLFRTQILTKFGLQDINILLLLDEYESFSESQQRVINTAMRFTNENSVCFRIGMRPNGFKTLATTTAEDFIKIGRDYEQKDFDSPLIFKNKDNPYPDLIKTIAAKRLAQTDMFRQYDIVNILGDDENLEDEAKSIVNGKVHHIDIYLNKINSYRVENRYSKLAISDISFIRDENPLFEMTCLRLLLTADGYKNNLNKVKKAFEDYKNKIKSDESDKFSNDYNNKYKMSFIFVLCSIYKKEKKRYYGFKGYCLLSSGIIGRFVDLCRRTFDRAYFKDNESLSRGKISSEIQTDIAYDFSNDERDMIKRIAKYGNKLLLFIDNIGNAFNSLHKEIEIRYPETNQFYISETNGINTENENLLEIACMWSLVIKKPNAQDVEGKNKKKDVYILNRAYSPFYKISYRTRGGFNPVKITDDYFETEYKAPIVFFHDSEKKVANNDMQTSLFDLIEDSALNFDNQGEPDEL